MENQNIKLAKNDNYQQFKVPALNERLNSIFFIKIIVQVDGKKQINVCGSGVKIAKQFILTAAHNVHSYVKLKQNNKGFTDRSHIVQAMHSGRGLGHFKIEQIYISKLYKHGISKSNDYAIIEISPISLKQQQLNKAANEKYYKLVAFKKEQLQKIKDIQVVGYPYDTNKKEYLSNQQNDGQQPESIIFMQNPYHAHGPPKKVNSEIIEYRLPTDKGCSGGPIFTRYDGQYIIVGIHTGTQQPKLYPNDCFNYSIVCNEMLSELNQIAYLKKQNPFVYTSKILRLKTKLHQQKLYFRYKMFQIRDIQVLMYFNLSHVTTLSLNDNNLGEKGLIVILNKNWPSLRSLYLPNNQIQSLANIQKKHWETIRNISTLSLQNNQLESLPNLFITLTKLKKLYLQSNLFNQIPNILVELCEYNSLQIVKFNGNRCSDDYYHSNQAKQSEQYKIWEKRNKECKNIQKMITERTKTQFYIHRVDESQNIGFS